MTKPFSFEGTRRMRQAEAGIEELQKHVDTLIVIPNQNLFLIANANTTFKEAFEMADEVLQQGVRGITDLMVMPGLINLDFADVRSVMSEMGKAMMGTGEAEGEHRAIEAAERAIANPLLDDISMKGARGVLINITGGPDLTLFEVDEAANRIREEVDPEANIIVGSTLDANMEGRMRVSVVATGIDAAAQQAGQPQQVSPALRLVTPPQAKPVNFGAMPRQGQSPAAAPAMQAAPVAQPVVTQTIVAHASAAPAAAAPMTAGATALAMPEPVAILPEPAALELPAPAALPESALMAPDMPLAADPAAFVAAAPVVEATAPRPFAAQLAEAQVAQPAFVPPAPQAMPTPVQAPAALRQPDPFAEADMVNKPAEPKKKASLFDRITGVARRAEAEPAPAMRQAEPQFTRQAAAPVAPVAAPAATVRVDPPRQADLGLTATAERTTPTRPQDDLLDIPAFLRRQAN